MKSFSQAVTVLVLGLLSLLGFIGVAFLVGRRQLAGFDQAVISFVQGLEQPQLTAVMKTFTFIGSTPVVAALSIGTLIFLYRVLHHRAELVLFLAIVGGTAIANFLLKHAFHRERPTLHRLITETGYSFPSGHSMTAFALYAALAFLTWRHIPTSALRVATIVVCVFMTLMIGISRIYLGVHYPSDVVGAYLASGCWFALSVWLFQWWKEYRYKHRAAK